MPTEFKSSRSISVDYTTMVDEYRAGLVTDPDSLLTIFDTIEKSMAAGVRAKAFCLSRSSVRVLIH